MEERLLRNALISLSIALEELPEETIRIIKSKLKKDLEEFLKIKQAAYEKAERYEEQCLQSDDGFSRETEDAMANSDGLRWEVNTIEDILKMFPPDKIYKITLTSGVHWVTES